jgi:hypothetical protein
MRYKNGHEFYHNTFWRILMNTVKLRNGTEEAEVLVKTVYMTLDNLWEQRLKVITHPSAAL